MQRKPQPPDFRYVWLLPGSSSALRLGAGTIGIAAIGMLLWNTGHPALSFGMTLVASAAAAFTFAKGERHVPARQGAREVAMAIVPWGVIVTPDTEPRTLRWPAIRKVSVDVTHSLRGGTPSILASLVTVETEHEVLAGRTLGAVELERLMANLESYAEEASRPIARDLDGFEALDDATEPVAAHLLREANELCTTSGGAARLSLPTAGYRSIATRLAAPETVAYLRRVLTGNGEAAADPRPLAAMVAGLLGAEDLVPDLVRLVSSPNPIVAACAKAAALRLGAPHSRAGAVEEVAAFLFDEDLEVISDWGKPALAAE